MDHTAQERETAFREIVQHLVRWGLPQDEVEYALHGAVEVVAFNPRARLFEQDTPVGQVYLIKEGRVFQERISQDRQNRRRVTLRREAGPGEWIGHYDLIYSQHHSTRARALDFSRLIAVQAAAFNRLLYRYPGVRQRIAPMDTIGRLRTVPLFAGLDLTALSYLADACMFQRAAAGTEVYPADAPADRVYVVDTGQIVLSGPNRPQTWLGNGMAFGFLDQPVPSPRETPPAYGHRAAATTDTTLYAIPRHLFVDLTDLAPEQIGLRLRQAVEEALAKVTVFADYDEQQRRTLAGYMSHYHVPIAHLVIQQGEMGDSLWVLMPGGRATLHALEFGQALQPSVIQGPNFFSEMALRVEHPLNSTVQAEPNSQWLRLHTDDFQAFLRDHGQHLLNNLVLSPITERMLGRSQARRRYSWLQKGENLVLFQRRHWLALLRQVSFAVGTIAVMLVAWVILNVGGWLAPWMLWLLGVTGVIASVQMIWGILDYLNDYLLVTNQRLVRQEKVLFVTEWRQAAFLEQIRSIDISISFLGNLFQYGEIRIQTAATGGLIAFDLVPQPNEIKRTILEQQNLRQRHYQASSKMVIQNLLEERFGLRLRLPSRVRPGSDSPEEPVAETFWRRLRRRLDIGAHMELHVKDKIIWRKHWFILIAKVAAPLTILILLLLLMLGERLLPPDLQAFVRPLDILFALFGLGTIGWMAWGVADWRNDTYEIDNRQIADVEKKPLFFSEQRRTALLGEIENIEISIPSPLHYLLNFGNVRLKTAAAQGDFTFDWVPDPRGVSEEIRRRIENYRQQQEADRARQRAQELPDWFEMYNRLGADGTNPL